MSIRLATVFSGIGAVEQAFKKINHPYDIIFACDNGERIIELDEEIIKENLKKLDHFEQNNYIKNLYDQTNKVNYVKKSYFENYEIDEDDWYEDIRFIDGSYFTGKVDILAGGSPCQSFSIIGKGGGLDDERGNLVFDFIRLVREVKPKVFIYENVPGMLSHNKGKTWEIIEKYFKELNYKIYAQILNSMDYGVPQNRRRVFVVGFRDEINSFSFPEYNHSNKTVKDYLEDNVIARHYLGKKGFEFVTNPKNGNRARVNRDVMQTQKANQQYNWNGDFVFEEFEKIKHRKDILERAYIGEYEGKKGVVRQLSYRECLRLMGFSDDFKIVVPNVPAYRQAGNSIVVNVLEAIITEIMKVVDFNEK